MRRHILAMMAVLTFLGAKDSAAQLMLTVDSPDDHYALCRAIVIGEATVFGTGLINNNKYLSKRFSYYAQVFSKKINKDIKADCTTTNSKISDGVYSPGYHYTSDNNKQITVSAVTFLPPNWADTPVPGDDDSRVQGPQPPPSSNQSDSVAARQKAQERRDVDEMVGQLGEHRRAEAQRFIEMRNAAAKARPDMSVSAAPPKDCSKTPRTGSGWALGQDRGAVLSRVLEQTRVDCRGLGGAKTDAPICTEKRKRDVQNPIYLNGKLNFGPYYSLFECTMKYTCVELKSKSCYSKSKAISQ